MKSLVNRLKDVMDDSDDYKLLVNILEEVEFLYSRGILREKNLGRLIDIIEGGNDARNIS